MGLHDSISKPTRSRQEGQRGCDGLPGDKRVNLGESSRVTFSCSHAVPEAFRSPGIGLPFTPGVPAKGPPIRWLLLHTLAPGLQWLGPSLEWCGHPARNASARFHRARAKEEALEPAQCQPPV